MIKVLKREGDRENANPQKIKDAMMKAFNALHYTVPEKTLNEMADCVSLWEDITIDEIHEEVIEVLREFGYDEVADAYLIYKAQKDEARKYIDESIDYMMEYINSDDNAATSSATDANANITLKNVSNLESEVPKLRNRLVQRAWVKRALKELYPELAKQYEIDLANHIIYAHDEASSPTVSLISLIIMLLRILEKTITRKQICMLIQR